MKALVTGAYGFIGRHVSRSLAAAGYEVYGLGHGTWGRDEWRRWGIVDWHAADVTVTSLLNYAGEPDAIIHCAGSGSVGFSMTHPAQDFERNVGTTLAVLEFIRIHRPRTLLVLPSSAGVYGRTEEMPILTSAELCPVSPYGLNKKVSEELCRSYGLHFDVRSAVVRLFSIYGIGLRKQLLWDACSKLATEAPDFAGTGRETRDWLHVEDAATLLCTAIDFASTECPVVNGGTGKASTIAEIVQRIAELLGSAYPPRFSNRIRAGDPTDYLADISGALKWGWRPTRQLEAETAAYVDWFKRGAP